jgi:hypothetical protein
MLKLKLKINILIHNVHRRYIYIYIYIVDMQLYSLSSYICYTGGRKNYEGLLMANYDYTEITMAIIFLPLMIPNIVCRWPRSLANSQHFFLSFLCSAGWNIGLPMYVN